VCRRHWSACLQDWPYDAIPVYNKVLLQEYIEVPQIPSLCGVVLCIQTNSIACYFTVMLQTSSQGIAQAAAMQSELADAKHELLKIQEMLEMAEKVFYCMHGHTVCHSL